MYITVDTDNYVDGFAIIGNLTDGIEIDYDVEDEDFFMEHYGAYKYENGTLVFDSARDEELQNEELIKTLRRQRESECFSYINRGQLWYDKLTSEQKEEFEIWYQAWLDVTETLTVPDKPEWLI